MGRFYIADICFQRFIVKMPVWLKDLFIISFTIKSVLFFYNVVNGSHLKTKFVFGKNLKNY